MTHETRHMSSKARMQALTTFLNSYRRAFEAFDPTQLAEHCHFPLQVAADEDQMVLTVIENREEYIGILEKVLDGYRSAGVADGRILTLNVRWLSDRLSTVNVHWEVYGGNGIALYDFQACYTVALMRDSWHICAIAHNELPRLARCRAGAVQARLS